MSGVGTRFFLAVEAPAKVLDLSGIEWLDAVVECYDAMRFKLVMLGVF